MNFSIGFGTNNVHLIIRQYFKTAHILPFTNIFWLTFLAISFDGSSGDGTDTELALVDRV